jgi:5-methylcytosine-specific restriction endonuclease McrA
MNAKFRKYPRLKLKPGTYTQLCRQVLGRDGWRCQNCGRASELQVHHLLFRSTLGGDTLGNLITLCALCHGKLHDRR